MGTYGISFCIPVLLHYRSRPWWDVRLSRTKSCNGHCFYIGNWYLSIEICENKSSTDVVGTLRRVRKGLPSDVTKKKLRTDGWIIMYGHHFGLAATHWKDERDVFIFTTCKRDGEAVVSRCGERVRIANVFHTYNLFLVGARRWQHHILQKKRVKKWYKKQFMHLIISSQFCLIMCISNLNALLLKKKWEKRRCFVI